MTSLGLRDDGSSSSMRVMVELLSERISGELTMCFEGINCFEGLLGMEQKADCCELVCIFVVALVVACSFSEQRVLLERQVPILTILFLRVKVVVGAESSPTQATFCLGLLILITFRA